MLICAELLFDGVRLRKDVCLRVENGVIVGECSNLPSDQEKLSCHLISPGFIDLHIHGCMGKDVMHGEEHVRFMSRVLPSFGVTAFAPTAMADSTEAMRFALMGVSQAMKSAPGAHVLGCHLEGPFLNSKKKGAQPQEYLHNPSFDLYRQIVCDYEDSVCMMTIAPELPGALEFIKSLSGKVVFCAGHTSGAWEDIAAAEKAGLTQATHLFNGMNPLSHREPGAPGACLVLDKIKVQLIADLIHLHPAILQLAWRAKNPSGCILISDSMEAAAMPDGNYTLGVNQVFVKNGEARLANGALAGSTLTLDRAVRNMAGPCGAGLARALRMATYNPAQGLNRKDMGRILPGYRADLVMLDKDLQVQRTMVDGCTVFQRG